MEIIDDYVYQAKKALEDLEIRRNELKGAM